MLRRFSLSTGTLNSNARSSLLERKSLARKRIASQFGGRPGRMASNSGAQGQGSIVSVCAIVAVDPSRSLFRSRPDDSSCPLPIFRIGKSIRAAGERSFDRKLGPHSVGVRQVLERRFRQFENRPACAQTRPHPIDRPDVGASLTLPASRNHWGRTPKLKRSHCAGPIRRRSQ